ncbi:MAG: YggS family pyridoxal phosphate-dependent enzyme [Gammaproteobacteria bacterium]|nr:YggS family pyridoxal phosphate-dependent enzyme [Gammaproteobacteria bacterium]NIR82717.1 YggS family pyridoxal phosphate-dependent enzyme [Gammaproteobacteria bacterium]NIR89581.1 YggS family pyridoxal phosphate-dependent enzyme [Gammaproteobacteria bacterium]NIU03877.1 YggS family pyridoxal phosphate-dependent enzyme [Gammaproteobacteria bacterium]NIV51193.1 YggS family pyridoxal phosphate-dependent enzyme [Gammaproteobacteria bacterium]
MNDIAASLNTVEERIRAAERRFWRTPGSVRLLAVSKAHSAAAIAEAYRAGQRAFGENYVQEALSKMETIPQADIEWHFIGPVQSNKTRAIGLRFSWVHSLERLKIARRLSEQRPQHLPPLNVCIQVNVAHEPTKSGVAPAEAAVLAQEVAELPGLRLRGLMAIPPPAQDFESQRAPFRRLRELLEALNAEGFSLDTLSMGMTSDMEAAIAEGATIVRIGTAIFGPREEKA